MLNVEQLKYSVNRMPVDRVADAVLELRLEGLVTGDCTPFGKVHFNTCFAELEALVTTEGWMWWAMRGCSMHSTTLAAGSRCRYCAG